MCVNSCLAQTRILTLCSPRLGKPDCKDERGSDVKKVRLLIPPAFSDSVARKKSLISTKVHCTIEKRYTYTTERY